MSADIVSRRGFLSASAAVCAAGTQLAPHTFGDLPTSRVRVAQIGTAHAHAEGKYATLCKLTDLYEVVGIVEPDADRRAAAAKRTAYASARWITESELLESSGAECVAVETEIESLVPTAQRCVDAGMHVHVDKPAGESLTALRTLHEAASNAGLAIQMGYMFRYNPAFQAIKEAVEAGWLGEIFEVHAVMSKKVNQATRDELRQYAGGTMFELGCHLVDALVWILGNPKTVTPYARQTFDDGLKDNMFAVCEYDKAVASIRTSVVEPFGFARRQFSVVGTKGVAELRPLEPAKLQLSLEQAVGPYKKGVQAVEFPAGAGRYDGDFIDLWKVIREQKDLAWDAAHDLATHEAILKASELPVS